MSKDIGVKPISVQVSILNQGWMRPELTDLLLRMLATNKKYKLHIEYPSKRPIQHNRNNIVKRFLKKERDYLLMIDCDVIPAKNPLDLIELDKDIIGLPCPTWKENEIVWLVMDKSKNGWKTTPKINQGGLIGVDAVGTGAILIKRDVLEAIEAPFNRSWSDDGTQDTGLDFMFCQKAKEAGFEVYAHMDYYCSHFNDFDLLRLGLGSDGESR